MGVFLIVIGIIGIVIGIVIRRHIDQEELGASNIRATARYLRSHYSPIIDWLTNQHGYIVKSEKYDCITFEKRTDDGVQTLFIQNYMGRGKPEVYVAYTYKTIMKECKFEKQQSLSEVKNKIASLIN